MLLSPFRSSLINAQTRYPQGLDVELRYGTFSEGVNKRTTFQPGVSLQTFTRLREDLAKITPVTIIITQDQVSGDVRLIKYQDGRQEWIIKSRAVVSHDIHEYGFRLTASQKTIVSPSPNFKATLIRDKIRYSYPLAGGAIRVDLTKVTSEGKTTYEVEVQLLNSTSFDAYSKASEIVLRLIQETVILYTNRDKEEITSYFNNLTRGKKDSQKLDENVMKTFRNLKMDDLVWGGLIGNKETGYKASHKIDGVRKLLVYAPNGIWLLGPNQYTRLTDTNFPTMTGTVLDGESIPMEKRKDKAPKKPYWYITFDILSWQGDLGVQKQPHSDRMKLAQLAIDRLESPYIEVNTSRFLSFNNPRRFFEVMSEMIGQKDLLAYREDGIIFTSETRQYNNTNIIWTPEDKVINKEVLQGKTFRFLEYYRERVINTFYQPLDLEEMLIDLTPRPEHWNKFKKVVAYTNEKSKDSNVVTVSNPEDLIQAVKSHLGEATVIVMNKVVPEIFPYLDDLIKETLSPDGRLEAMFLDASSCQEMFNPAFTPSLSLQALDLNGLMTLTYDPINQILSTPSSFQGIKASQIPLRSLAIHRCDSQEFMSLHEQMYGRLFSFGRFQVEPFELTQKPEIELELGDETKAVEKRSERVISPKPVGAPLSMINPSIRPVRSRATKESPLSLLPVNKPKNMNEPGVGDDVIEKLTVTWTKEEVYRIACIGDGSCFFHAYFKGFYDEYQDNNSYEKRQDIVRGFRNELATLLTLEDPENPDKIFYETVTNGSLRRMGEEQKSFTELMKDDFGNILDYSLKGMVQLLNSDRDVGDEVYGYVSEIVGIGIHVMRGTNKDLYNQISVGVNLPSVVIIGNGNHYEVIGVMKNGKLQTIFDPIDQFIVDFKKK